MAKNIIPIEHITMVNIPSGIGAPVFTLTHMPRSSLIAVAYKFIILKSYISYIKIC